MATGVVIRLTNLPLAAGAIDIRHFFKGLKIPDGGVHIIGGDDGTAFILFSTDEDARRAMLQSSLMLCGAKITLMLSSHSEMKAVIEQSQRMCEKLRGQRLTDPPITNLSNQSSVRSFQPKISKKQPSPESLDANDVYIEIKGMPFSVHQNDIVIFFSPLNVSAIKFMLDEKGRKTGSGFIKFATAIEKLHGLKRDRKFIGSRFVKLSSVSERQWLLANSIPCETVRLESGININRKRQQSHTSDETTPKRLRDLSPLKTDNCVEISGLPSTVTFKNVGDFFTRLKFVDGGLYVEMDGSVCKGIAYVEFKTYNDYELALKKDGDILNGKQVRVISLSKHIMLDKITHHKKYVKSKREELEKQKAQSVKQLDHQKKKESHLRKHNKEMDEWLRRQHEKEQRERMKVESEKQLLQSLDEQKLLAQLLSDAKALESLKQTGDIHLKNEIIRKLEELAGKSISEKEQSINTEEPLLGAGEMELDDDNGNEESLPSSSQIQQNVAITTASVTYPFTGAGNSGSMVVPQLPLSFNPSMSFINSFPYPSMPALTPSVPTLTSSHLLPAKPPFLTSQAPGLNPPPLPPIAVPPPIPPVIGSLPPSFQSAIASIPNVSTVLPTFSGSEIKLHDKSNEVIDSEYVRVANSPFNVTEDEVRNFFAGLQIPKQGIQFINKLNGKRSGHIYIRFSSKDEAAKAVFKNNQILVGRNVLVKSANMKSFNAIYEKLTKGGKYVSTITPPPASKIGNDNIFTKRILDDQMTCVCIGNIPSNATEDDIIKILANIKFVKSKIVLLRDASGACKGDAYVEVENPSECVKAADLHGVAKIGEQIIRVLPLTVEAMKKDIQSRQEKPNYSLHISKANGHAANKDAFSSNHQDHKLPPHHNDLVNHGLHSLSSTASDATVPPSQDLLKNAVFDPSIPPQPFTSAGMLLPPIADDLLRLPNHLGFPPIHSIPPPPLGSNLFLNHPPPLPFPPNRVFALKMSNLSFKVTREDIVEFFAGFDLLPDSIRLMYNNSGKLTGDGILAFASFEGATAALNRLNGNQFLGRKLKLIMQ